MASLNHFFKEHVGTIGFMAGALLALTLATTARTAAPAPRPNQSLIGDTLPEVTLRSPAGDVRLRDRTQGRPSLILVISMADCLSCSNIPLELEIIRKGAPDLNLLVVGSGSGPDAFFEQFQRMRLDGVGLVDTDRQLVTRLRVPQEPLVLLVDSIGRILFADTRSTSRAAQFPVGQVFHLMRQALGRSLDAK